MDAPPRAAGAWTPCPDVESARAMLAKAAATENDRALKEAPAPAPGKQEGSGKQEGPGKEKGPGKLESKQAPKGQPGQPPPAAAPPAPAGPDPSPEKKRAALLVKEADEACQAGQTAAASEKAKAAMALLRQ